MLYYIYIYEYIYNTLPDSTATTRRPSLTWEIIGFYAGNKCTRSVQIG